MDAEALISKIISKYHLTRITKDCGLLILEFVFVIMNSPHSEEIQQVHFHLVVLFGFFS